MQTYVSADVASLLGLIDACEGIELMMVSCSESSMELQTSPASARESRHGLHRDIRRVHVAVRPDDSVDVCADPRGAHRCRRRRAQQAVRAVRQTGRQSRRQNIW